MSNQRGFSPIQILLIIVALGLVVGTGWFVWQSKNKTTKTLDATSSATSDVAKTDKKPAPEPVDPTAAWVAYSSTKGVFSLRYPKTWVQPTNKDLCTASLFDRTLYLGPNADSVLHCGSEFFGQVAIGSVDGDKRGDYDLGSDYKDIAKKDVSINDVSGQRISGTAKAPAADAVFAPAEGTIEVHYAFYTKGNTYYARYTQPKAAVDVLADFDLLVTKTLEFNP